MNAGKTAIHRITPSVPARALIAHGYLRGIRTLLDYGSGHGADVRYYGQYVPIVAGYDPYHGPYTVGHGYDLVVCTYVVNVLATVQERLDLIHKLRRCSGSRVIIAARSTHEINQARTASWRSYNDGWLTSRGTFQRGFTVPDMLELLAEAGCNSSTPLPVIGSGTTWIKF